MARLFEHEDQYFFEPEENISFPLNENNFFVNLHRDAQYMDRVGIQDPSDMDWWTWFRADQPEEIFERMVEVAHVVGTILLRGTPLTEIEAQFDKRHAINDDELETFFEEQDGTPQQ